MNFTDRFLYLYVIITCVLNAVMCLKLRQIVDNLNRNIKYETYNEELDKCDYIEYGNAI